MTQKDAVFSAITSVLKDAGLSFTPGADDANALLTKELRYNVNEILIGQLLNKEMEMSEQARDRLSQLTDMRAYVSGLVSNWLRKDSRLNGNSTAFVQAAINKTSNDPQIKAMRHLMSAQQDEKKRLEIQAYIDKRIQELTQ